MDKETLAKRIAKSKAEARARIIKRGIISFHLEPELFQLLLETAKNLKEPPGRLVHRWVTEHLEEKEVT